MNDETARPWRWSYEEATGDLVIHGPPYPGKDDACDIVLVDGAYLCGDDAALIVKAVNRDAAFDALVEALHQTVAAMWSDDSAEKGRAAVLARDALEAVGSVLGRSRDSRNGEAKR